MKYIIKNNPILYNPKWTIIINFRPLLANTNKIVDLGNEIEREDIDGKYTFLNLFNFFENDIWSSLLVFYSLA